MKNLEQLLTEIENHIPHAEKANANISDADVSWHLAHSLIVIENVIKALQKSNPDEFERKFSKWKFIVFLTKKIPRGRAKAPEPSKPKQVYTVQDLEIKLQQIKNLLPSINSLSKNAFFVHPIFKKINSRETKKFLAIHTNHHLKIVREIIG